MRRAAAILPKPYWRIVMFIAHGGWLRKYARWILAGVLALLIPSFIALFSQSGSSRRREVDLPTVRGKPVNAVEFQRVEESIRAQVLIRTGKQLSRTSQIEDQLRIEAVSRLVQLRKAKEFGIVVSDAELIRQIRSQFLNDSKQFDPERYRHFMILLNNYSISESQFENIMREEITLARLRTLIGSGAKVTPTEIDLTYRPLHEKVGIDLVEFDVADQKEPITITDDAAKAFFEQHQESFRKPALVKVRYVRFAIADARKSIKVTDPEIADYYERNQSKYADTNNVAKPLDSVKDEIREELLTARVEREAADRATAMTTNLVFEANAPRPDFAKVAAAFGVTPRETDYFGARDKVPGVEADLQFNQEAFALDPNERPFSDPVGGKDGYYVLEYRDSKPSVIPPFEQVKAKVIDTLKQQRALEATVKRGQDALTRVKQAVATGKSFAATCAELKLKHTSPEAFSMSDKIDLPAAATIKQTVLGMATNSVSEFISTAKGGLFFHLKQRWPPDPAQFEKDKPQLAEQILQRNRQALFQDWLTAVIRDEQVNFGRQRSQPQPVEQPSEEETIPPVEPAATPPPAPAKS
jgi:peptidyl-prolyl cis-trans isomerase D